MPGRSEPYVMYVELNWGLLSDCVLAYLEASSSPAQTANLLGQAKEVLALLGELGPGLPDEAKAQLKDWVTQVGRKFPLPVDKAANYLEQGKLALQMVKVRRRS